MVKNYEIINKFNECELHVKHRDIYHKFTFSKTFGYTKKFYEQLLYDINNFNQGENYEEYINNKIVDLPIITCNNGELYFTNISTFLGIKSEIRLSHTLSNSVLSEIISYFLSILLKLNFIIQNYYNNV